MRVPLFQRLEEGAVRDICLAMIPMTVLHGEYIYRENQLGREMYVIEEGQVQLSRYGLVIGVMQKNSFFGEAALQPGRRLRDRSAYALVDSILALLSKTDCERIAKDYPNLITSFEHVAARKTKIEAIRMNQLLQEAADSLGVELQSSVMKSVLDSVGQMTAVQSVEEAENKAVEMMQHHARGWLARKKALTKTAIRKGTLNASPSAMSLEVNDAQEMVKTKGTLLGNVGGGSSFKKKKKTRVKLSDTKNEIPGRLRGGLSQMTKSLDSVLSQDMSDPKRPKQKQDAKRASRTKSWRGVYLAPDSDGSTRPDPNVNAEAINEIAAKMAHEIMNAREGPASSQQHDDIMVAKLDLDGDGEVDVVGYDTTGDGVIDALDTNLDGRVDTDIIEEAGLQGRKFGYGGSASMMPVGSKKMGNKSPKQRGQGANDRAGAARLGAIERTLQQVLQGQEALAEKHDALQNMMQNVSALLQNAQSMAPATHAALYRAP